MRMFWVLSSWFKIAFGSFEKILVDCTREEPSIIADMENSGIDNAEGVNFSVPRKSEVASLLKQRMSNNKFFYPLLNWERPYRGDICTELNVERYYLLKDGTYRLFTPQWHTRRCLLEQ